jgi:BON domain
MILIRLLLFPVKLALRLLGFTLKVGYVSGRVPVRLTGRSVRFLGVRGLFFLLVGVAVGLFLAPMPGAELLRKVQALLQQGSGGPAPGGDDDLAGKVSFELAHAPRTWHLDQPEVSVGAGRVILRGSVPGEDAREELARVAGAIPGVEAVDNQVTVASVV